MFFGTKVIAWMIKGFFAPGPVGFRGLCGGALVYRISFTSAMSPSCEYHFCGEIQFPVIDGPLRSKALAGAALFLAPRRGVNRGPDRKSTRLNSSHLGISYAVFCLKKKEQ